MATNVTHTHAYSTRKQVLETREDPDENTPTETGDDVGQVADLVNDYDEETETESDFEDYANHELKKAMIVKKERAKYINNTRVGKANILTEAFQRRHFKPYSYQMRKLETASYPGVRVQEGHHSYDFAKPYSFMATEDIKEWNELKHTRMDFKKFTQDATFLKYGKFLKFGYGTYLEFTGDGRSFLMRKNGHAAGIDIHMKCCARTPMIWYKKHANKHVSNFYDVKVNTGIKYRFIEAFKTKGNLQAPHIEIKNCSGNADFFQVYEGVCDVDYQDNIWVKVKIPFKHIEIKENFKLCQLIVYNAPRLHINSILFESTYIPFESEMKHTYQSGKYMYRNLDTYSVSENGMEVDLVNVDGQLPEVVEMIGKDGVLLRQESKIPHQVQSLADSLYVYPSGYIKE